MPRRNSIGIVIVNWNNKREILMCLASLEEAGFIENLVIVDNASIDGSPKVIRGRYNEIKIIENKRNLGYAEGNNVGVRYLLKKGVKYVFILNPDTIILKDTIPNLVKYMEKNKEVGITGSKVYSIPFTPGESIRPPLGWLAHSHTPEVFSGKIWSCGGVIDKKRYSGGLIGYGEVDRGQYDTVHLAGVMVSTSFQPATPEVVNVHMEDGIEVDYVPGAAMMVRREVFEKVGLFHSPYFIYYEDVELCIRAREAGFKVQLVPRSIIYHNESSSMVKNSPAQSYYLARNHLLFVERNAPLSIKIRELIRLPKTIYEHIQKREKYALLGIRDYFLRKFGRRNY